MEDQNQDNMASEVTAAVLDAIQKRDHDISEARTAEMGIEQVGRKAKGFRDIAIALSLVFACVSSVILTLSELQAKPSKVEMTNAINEKVDPVIERLKPVEQTVETLTDNVDRIRSLQEMQMQHSSWRAAVADCRARASCKRAPSKPQSLKDKELSLMTNLPTKGSEK